MARTTQNPRLINRTVRIKLAVRRDPYWHLIAEGQHLGYRRNDTAGTWIARMYDRGQGRRFQALASADDVSAADGKTVLTFAEAMEAAQAWFRRRSMEDTGEVVGGPYTVAEAMEDYVVERERTKRKKLPDTRATIKAHILPTLGKLELSKLTHGRVKAWRDALAEAAPRSRTASVKVKIAVTHKLNGVDTVRMRDKATADSMPQAFRAFDPSDADAVRKRQATVNRILSILKAGLNHAHSETKRVATKAAWETVKPFRQVDVPRVRFLTLDEAASLLANCPSDFGKLVRAALLTGCRYGELARMHVSAFDPGNETIFVPVSKNGESRHIELNAEGSAYFAVLTAGRSHGETMFTHSNGKPWKKSEQKPPMDAACEVAKLEQVTFHILRHTYASHLAMNQTPMRVIADQLGHKDTRITERHYAHLGRAYVRDTIRTRLPSFGVAADGKANPYDAIGG
jgi:integrase